MSSDSKRNIKHDRNEDVIFEREPKGWNEEEDEEGEPNVSLKWKSLKLQDYKESEKDSVKQTANGKKNHPICIRCGQDNFIFLP